MDNEERKDRLADLRRYEDARRKHLGGAINLVFGLATAALGFCGSRLVEKDFTLSAFGSRYFVAATSVFAVAVLISILVTWTRPQDFRGTAKKIRRRHTSGA